MKQPIPLTENELDQLKDEYPSLPYDYLCYLREIGWGETPGGYMIYSEPISPSEIYPDLIDMQSRLIIGDDFQGYCLGFDFKTERYGEFSDTGKWTDFPEAFDLSQHLKQD